MEAENPKSIILVTHSHYGSYRALYEVKIQQGGEIIGVADDGSRSAATRKKRRPLLEPVIKLFDDNTSIVVPEHSDLATVRFFSPSKLYLWLNNHQGSSKMQHNKQIQDTTAAYGYVLDMETKSLVPLKSPEAHKPSATVISAYGKLYHLANPECESEIPTLAFERYDPVTDCWESLTPYPIFKDVRADQDEMRIIGYVVYHSFILFTIEHYRKPYFTSIGTRIKEYWAFDVTRKQWHQVKVWPPSEYRPMERSLWRGRAVVEGDSIYTLDYSCSNVVAFKFWWDLDEYGDVSFYVSPESILKVLEIRQGTRGAKKQGCLVHLGKLDFCLVQNLFQPSRAGNQEFCITTFQIVGEGGGRHIRTLYSTICEMDTLDASFISLDFCFSPDVDDIEPKQEQKQKTEHFSLFGTSGIPEDLKFDILARLPTKDLLQFMCVSKAWNAAIQDPDLAKLHFQLSLKSNSKSFYIISSSHKTRDDRVYPVALFNNNVNTKVGGVVKVKHRSDEVWKERNILGSCDGLLCISRSGNGDSDVGLWNPAIHKFKKIPLSAFSKLKPMKTFHGFGYDPVNHDYKYVRLAQFKDHGSSEVQVYSLESHSWKRIQDLPAHLNEDYELISPQGVCVDGVLHWLMRLRGARGRPIVLTLHLATEEFHWFSTPDYICQCDCREPELRCCLCALGSCLCFRHECMNYQDQEAWILKQNGDAESWTTLYSTTELPELQSCRPLMLSQCGKMVLLSDEYSRTVIYWFDLEKRRQVGVTQRIPEFSFLYRFDTVITSQTLHLLRRRPELPCNYCC